jgi:thiol-disulfide isomerase/thioredoxin
MKKIINLYTIIGFIAALSLAATPVNTALTNNNLDTNDSITQGSGINEMPNISLKDINGNLVNIKTLADSGKITIVTFWATWCKPCLKELNNTLDLIDDWKADYNVQYYAVSVDDAKTTHSVKPMATALGYVDNYNILLDPNKDLARNMNVNNPPMIFIYDTNGSLVYSHMGYTEGAEYDVDDKLKAMNKKEGSADNSKEETKKDKKTKKSKKNK